jgi:sugar phosphate isomerase/epimerase
MTSPASICLPSSAASSAVKLPGTPAIWRKMWEIIPDDNFGLNLDPAHLILQMIDYERVIHEFSDKIFHIHAKDLHIDREGLGGSYHFPKSAFP